MGGVVRPGKGAKLEAVDRRSDPPAGPALLDPHYAGIAIDFDGAARQVLKIQREPDRLSLFQTDVGDEIDAARTDVARHAFATAFQPDDELGFKSFFFTSGHTCFRAFGSAPCEILNQAQTVVSERQVLFLRVRMSCAPPMYP